MRSRRPRASVFLLICAATLLVSIVIGERMGARVLHQATRSAVMPALATPSITPTTAASGGLVRDWKKAQVITIATDPGFLDPRVTRPPTPTPTPVRTPTPSPTPSPTPPAPSPTPVESPTPFTSPTPETTRPPVR